MLSNKPSLCNKNECKFTITAVSTQQSVDQKIQTFDEKLIDISERLKLIEAGKRLHNQATESRENVAEYDDIAKDSEISDTDSYDTVYNEGPYRFEVKIALCNISLPHKKTIF